MQTWSGQGGRTHKEVVGVRVGASNLEELHQVVELTVNVSADGDGAFLAAAVSALQQKGRRRRRGCTYDGLNVGLVLQDFSRLLAQSLDVGLGQLLAGHQGLNPAVEGRNRRRVGGRRHGVVWLCADIFHVGVHAARALRPGVATMAWGLWTSQESAGPKDADAGRSATARGGT